MAELLEEQAAEALQDCGAAPRGARILAAVSGGADSVCLVHVLRDLGYGVEVGHFDHQTRAGGSGRDAAFVRDLAASLGLPFHVESRPVQAEAQASGLSFQEYAREVRYAFLCRVARDGHCAAVATGHHADDQAETVLMRLLRGTAASGAAGIPPVTVLHGVPVVRPLLRCARADIVAWLEARSIPWREDETNAEPGYLRNRVRLELLPLLARGYNPRVRDALIRFADALRADAEYLDHLAEEAYASCVDVAWAVDRARFRALPRALQRRVAAALTRRAGMAECPFERLERLVDFVVVGATGAAFDAGGGVLLRNGRETSHVVRDDGEDAVDLPVPVPVPGRARAHGWVFDAAYLDAAPAGGLAAYCTPARQVFDADALGGPLEVRRWRPGDRFAPLGLEGSKTLGDYFTDLGVPVEARRNALVLVTGGRIAWVIGRAPAAFAAVTDRTRRFLEIRVAQDA